MKHHIVELERRAYSSGNAEVAKLLGRIDDLETEIERLDACVEDLEIQIADLLAELDSMGHEHITLGGRHE